MHNMDVSKASKAELEAAVEALQQQVKQLEASEQERLEVQQELEKHVLESVAARQTLEEQTTQLLLAVNDLERAKEKAEEASQIKSAFLANMSHEMRTPLNGILATTEMLFDTVLNREQHEFANLISISSQNLLGLINEILDISKLEAGKLTLEVIEFDLNECCTACVRSLALTAQQKDLRMNFFIASDVPRRILGDPGRLRQILINLLGNAVKFTSKGEVLLAVTLDKMQAEHSIIRFTVCDTGIGIPEDKQKRIFEKFTQADDSMTRKFGGTGLGLSISTELVELMQGDIWVESPCNWPHLMQTHLGVEASPSATAHKSCGSAFTFTGCFEVPQQASEAVIETQQSFRKIEDIRILLIREADTERYIFEHLLSQLDVVYDIAANAGEAVSCLKGAVAGEPYNVLLVSDELPDVDGYDLVADLDSEFNTVQKTLMLSKLANQHMVARRCRELGLSGYLTTPVVEEELQQYLARILNQKHSGSSASHAVRANGAARGSAAGEITAAGEHLSCRILLVDDNVINQKVGSSLLEKLGHRVTVAGNGKEAIARWDVEKFDLILMDLMMPELDGMVATRMIRLLELKRDSYTPILALTANAMKGDRERCLAAGMDGYISKPVKKSDLQKAISIHVNRGHEVPADSEI